MIVYTDKHRVPFVIDEADFEAVARYSWSISGKGYPCTRIGKWPGGDTLTLHMFLLGPCRVGFQWDHRDRDKMNNCRWNLRAVTGQINQRNRGVPMNNRSGVVGVALDPNGRWRAQIHLGSGKNKHLGYFQTIEEAIDARRDAERELWGDPR